MICYVRRCLFIPVQRASMVFDVCSMLSKRFIKARRDGALCIFNVCSKMMILIRSCVKFLLCVLYVLMDFDVSSKLSMEFQWVFNAFGWGGALCMFESVSNDMRFYTFVILVNRFHCFIVRVHQVGGVSCTFDMCSMLHNSLSDTFQCIIIGACTRANEKDYMYVH